MATRVAWILATVLLSIAGLSISNAARAQGFGAGDPFGQSSPLQAPPAGAQPAQPGQPGQPGQDQSWICSSQDPVFVSVKSALFRKSSTENSYRWGALGIALVPVVLRSGPLCDPSTCEAAEHLASVRLCLCLARCFLFHMPGIFSTPIPNCMCLPWARYSQR